MTVLVTGSTGFVGSHLMMRLRERGGLDILTFDRGDNEARLKDVLQRADVIFHLAAENRPQNPAMFESTNHGLTANIIQQLSVRHASPSLVLASSTQANLDNPYGQSKRLAEEAVIEYAKTSGAATAIYRYPNIFGKWAKPNYNSVVATFAYNVANDIPLRIDDATATVNLVHIDDVTSALLSHLDRSWRNNGDQRYLSVHPTYRVTVGALAESFSGFASDRASGVIPNMSDELNRRLYSVYISYLPPTKLTESQTVNSDQRGSLFELVKSASFGQIFVSSTKPGVTRGNHYHHQKIEKFHVLRGQARIRLVDIRSRKEVAFEVRGEECRTIDIPPGYSHSIENVGDDELLVIFWASEIFDPDNADTFSVDTTS